MSLPFFLSAQENMCRINQFNENGEKEGLWVSKNSFYKTFEYFKNGKENGFYYCINLHTNTLAFAGEKADGKYVSLFCFSESGHIDFSFTSFQDNNLHVPKSQWAYMGDGIPKFKCVMTSYYPSGNKKKEGTLLCDDEPIIDSAQCGEWKYYDEQGFLSEVKIYGDTIKILHPGDEGWPE